MNEYRNIEALRQIVDMYFAGWIDHSTMTMESLRLNYEVRKCM